MIHKGVQPSFCYGLLHQQVRYCTTEPEETDFFQIDKGIKESTYLKPS